MEFEWDEAKNASNLAKHGVSFELAHEFDWYGAIVVRDDRMDYGEERYLARGHAADGAGYSIVFTRRGAAIRVISIRPFNRKEYSRYGKRE
ncbi:BrnT family toxin [Devosia naphthalenivorans]|uniref:BrnT family toxin n=1 Tax=Devosia naphthalenivorans TaxID=2082392 RepID=UPI000D347216|nr:BrnT family toxin [Devosia naphthalenivorans]